jgi:hypothetical protein
MRRRLGVHLALIVVLAAAAPSPAGATPPIERKARALGLPAADCTYCHAFTMEHMNKRALEMKVAPMNCYACHGNRLPLVGRALFNARGRWLVDAKRAAQAKEVDPAWLRDYVPSPAPVPSPRH